MLERWKLSSYHAASPAVLDEEDCQTKRVIFATRTAEARVVTEAVYQLLAESQIEALPEAILQDLIDIELVVPGEEDELATILARHRASTKDEDSFYLVVQPTAACQLGCDYCGQQHGAAHLSDDDQRALVATLRSNLSARPFRRVHVGWFGGEPLLRLPEIRDLSSQFQSLCDDHGVSYSANIVTNGVLLTKKVSHELLSPLGITEVEITLDGTAESHDTRRNTKGGKPTFQRIFSNLLAIAAEPELDDLKVNVRCNVDSRNASSVDALIDLLAENDLQHRVSFYVAPVHSWGNDAHVLTLEKEAHARREVEWLSRLVAQGFDAGLLPGTRPTVCLAVKEHGLLVDAYGELFNCTEVSYVPTYERSEAVEGEGRIPVRQARHGSGVPREAEGNGPSLRRNRYAIGHVREGIMAEERPWADFNDRIEDDDYPCASCRMLPVCGGACPKLWSEGIVPCPPAKYNIEERLVLSLAEARTRARA